MEKLKNNEVNIKNFRKAWLIWGVAALFYLYEMILRISPSVMTEGLMLSFNATSTMLGILISFYYYSYTILQIPIGIILDKVGPKNLIIISIILCIIGSVLFAGTQLIYVAQIGRFLVGAGSACAFISCLQIGILLFPKKYFALIAGATNAMGTLGGLFGGVPIAISVNEIGWKNTTYLLAGIGLIILLLVIVLVPNVILDSNKKSKLSIIESFYKIISNKQIVLSGIIAGLMYLPISAFTELWAVPFFMKKHGISNEIASFVSSILLVGVGIGSIFLAFIAKRINSYIKSIRFFIFITTILFIFLIYYSTNLVISFFIVFLIGIFTGAQVMNFTCAKDNGSEDISATTLAFTNTLVMLIGAIIQPILGVIIDIFWTGKISYEGTRVYDVSCYQNAILSLPICLAISYGLSLFIKDSFKTKK